jgi:hypothetical protein
MKRKMNPKKNEHGSVLVVALVILVLLTLMGISVTTTSDIEVQIAKNEQKYVEEFYVADSAWKQGVEWLDSLASRPPLVNSALFFGVVEGETVPDNFLNIRNYGQGEGGNFNEDFVEDQDGTLGTGVNQVDYWYKVGYPDNSAMYGTRVPLFGENFRRYSYVITGHAGGTDGQEVQVTVTRVMEAGEY